LKTVAHPSTNWDFVDKPDAVTAVPTLTTFLIGSLSEKVKKEK